MLRRVISACLSIFLFALTFICSQSANAQAQTAAYKSPVYAPAYSWTGPYIGMSLGGRWANAAFTVISIGGAAPAFPATASRFPDSSTFRVGGYLGYNWQVAPLWLVGVEADFAWGKGSKFIPGIAGGTPAPVAGDSTLSEHLWDGSIRGRAGFLVTPTWLFYGTAGVAWQKIECTTICSAATCGALGGIQTDSRTHTGWTLGGGIEGVISANWLLRAEYRYADYGTWRHTYFTGAAATVSDSKARTNTALLGLAYKF